MKFVLISGSVKEEICSPAVYSGIMSGKKG
jgi:hypothetical protein